MSPIRSMLAIALLSLTLPNAASAALQGSVFTYQGKIEQSGVAVDGARNLRFRLFTEPTGGVQIGSDVALPGQVIEGGVFTVPLDFGLLAFNGEARYLEIAVDDNTLAPRQLVTNAPYALFALDGGTPYTGGAGIAINGTTIQADFGTDAGTVAQGNAVIHNQGSSPQTGAAFNIAGAGRAAEFRADSSFLAGDAVAALRVRSRLDGVSPLTERFKVDSAGSLLATGLLGVGTVPATGNGERMMWYSNKAAFRAGSVNAGTGAWDDGNVGYYSTAMGLNTVAIGLSSVALGDGNTVSGQGGFTAGRSNVCNAQSCVAIGSVVTAGSFDMALGTRVGSGAFTGSFIWGDASATVANNTANNQFMARASGGFRFRTSADLSTGCDLPAGTGVFQCTSDRDTKHDFRALDAEEILLRVTALPVASWRYRNEPGQVRHAGPTAQDFHAAFGLGNSDRSIGMLDIDGVNMLAIQALATRTEELAKKDLQIDALQARVDALWSAVMRVEARLPK